MTLKQMRLFVKEGCFQLRTIWGYFACSRNSRCWTHARQLVIYVMDLNSFHSNLSSLFGQEMTMRSKIML